MCCDEQKYCIHVCGSHPIIPVNRDSGTGVGFLGQFHLYLDDIFPKTYGQPLIGGTGAQPKMLTF